MKTLVLKVLGIIFFAVTFFLVSPKESSFAAIAPSSVTAVPGPNSGQVTLSWNQEGPVKKYSLVFGNSSGNYNMGLADFPADLRSLTVSHMTTGQRYFFQVWSFDDPSGPAAKSVEVSAVAK